MQRYFTLIAFIAVSLIGFSQDKLFTIEDAVIGQWRQLYPKTLHNVQWQGESNNFTFQDYKNLYLQAATKNDSITIFSVDKLNSVLTDAKLDSVSYFPYIKWENNDEFYFYANNYWCAVSISEKEVIASIILPENAQNKTLLYSKKFIAYTIDNNLYVTGVDNKKIAVTNDVDKNFVNGQAVSRNEFGIESGIFWSPEGNYIAFYRKDESDVKNYPLVDITKREAEVENIKYPMAGMKSEHISLGVYNINTKKTLFIENEPESEKYLTNITWSPDETNIYIQVLNREQNHMKLNKYNVSDGSLVKTLFEEKNEKYVEPLFPLTFLPNKSDRFIYLSRNNGYNHAFLYDISGKLIKQITSGNWEIINIIKISGNYMYYISTEQSPIERHLYKININSGKKTKLTGTHGTHRIVFNNNSKYFVDIYSNTETPNKILVVSTSGKQIRQVLKADNPLSTYNMPEMKIGTIKSADGKTDLYYRLIKPTDFDSTKHYPAVVYVYGGPHAQMITDSWLGGARMWNYYMAQKGYVMFTVDNRGSANRGLTFENVIHRQCGVAEMKDQIKGIEFLKTLGYVDKNKIGVHGWSYGGFMTTSLIVNYPDIFKVGVAGGPVIDWKYYEIMYGERYMDTPQENPDGFVYTSLIPRAKNLKGKLLIIHGAMDNTVVWQHSLLFIRECIKNNVPIDYFVYPRAKHNVRDYDRIHLMDKVTKYFDDYLK
jgi:dipeptidyl-peptidase-4